MKKYQKSVLSPPQSSNLFREERMSRKKEFIKRSEARIIIYMITAAKHRMNGSDMARKLKMDYIYLMKLLREMYDKGWIGTHKYNETTFFHTTAVTPIKEANKRMLEGNEQIKLKYGEIR